MGHGQAVGHGWARGQPMKSENCLDFVQVQTLSIRHGHMVDYLMLVQSPSSLMIVQSMSRVWNFGF